MTGILNESHRQQIEYMLFIGMDYGDIAEKIGVSLTCVYTEVKKNSVDGVYSALEAHRQQEERVEAARARQKETWAAKKPDKGKCSHCKGLGRRWIYSNNSGIPLEVICRSCK